MGSGASNNAQKNALFSESPQQSAMSKFFQMLNGDSWFNNDGWVEDPSNTEWEDPNFKTYVGLGVNRYQDIIRITLRRNNLRNNPAGENVAIMLDTKGPEIRMGGLKVCKETGDRKAKILLTSGETLQLTTDPAYNGSSDASTLYIDYPRLVEVVSPGDKVLLDDGLVSLEV